MTKFLVSVMDWGHDRRKEIVVDDERDVGDAVRTAIKIRWAESFSFATLDADGQVDDIIVFLAYRNEGDYFSLKPAIASRFGLDYRDGIALDLRPEPKFYDMTDPKQRVEAERLGVVRFPVGRK